MHTIYADKKSRGQGMFPKQNLSVVCYSDGQHVYQHVDLVIYLSDKACFSCQQNLEGVVDDFIHLSLGEKVSLCAGCKQQLQLIA